MLGTNLETKPGFQITIDFKVDGQTHKWLHVYNTQPTWLQIAHDSGLQFLTQIPAPSKYSENVIRNKAVRCNASGKLFEDIVITLNNVEVINAPTSQDKYLLPKTGRDKDTIVMETNKDVKTNETPSDRTNEPPIQ